MTELGIPTIKSVVLTPTTEVCGVLFSHIKETTEAWSEIRINADAGLFDAHLMTRKHGPDIGKRWERDRLRDRLRPSHRP